MSDLNKKKSFFGTYSVNISKWLIKTLSLASEIALLFKNSGSLTGKVIFKVIKEMIRFAVGNYGCGL